MDFTTGEVGFDFAGSLPLRCPGWILLNDALEPVLNGWIDNLWILRKIKVIFMTKKMAILK